MFQAGPEFRHRFSQTGSASNTTINANIMKNAIHERLQHAIALGFGCTAAASAGGHHSHSNIDRSNIQQHTGIVSEYSWSMPHVYLKVLAPNPAGDVVEYSIELLHPPGMLRRGWSRDSFMPGDRITWSGASDVNPNRYYSGLDWAERGDGVRFTSENLEEEVSPSSDFTGMWVRDLRGERPTYAAPTGWPLTALARREVDNYDEVQNPALDCEDQGPPRATLLPYPIRISRPDDGTIIMEYELREGYRTIYLDNAPGPGEPSIWGYSVARFEGDELVVETNNFIANRWGSHAGIDSSDEKLLVERFRLANGGLAIDMEMTLTDPVYLTAPVTFEYHLSKVMDREFVQVECTRESARLFLEGGYSR